jgi:hypothetical protein
MAKKGDDSGCSGLNRMEGKRAKVLSGINKLKDGEGTGDTRNK